MVKQSIEPNNQNENQDLENIWHAQLIFDNKSKVDIVMYGCTSKFGLQQLFDK